MTNLHMNEHLNLHKKTIGLVYDVPNLFSDIKKNNFNLPNDATSEWESQDTIDIIHTTWKEIGFDVILFPVDNNFLTEWTNKAHQCSVIHSLVEGFGSLAREGWIPSLCELTGIPYIGSNPFVHSVCMNKNHIKIICKTLNIPTADSYLIQHIDEFKNIKDSFFEKTHFIKPNCEGSGMGVCATHSISSNKNQTVQTVAKLLKLYPDGILIESYLSGAEYTTGIIGNEKKFLPIAQIEVPDSVYGAANKTKDYLCEKVTFPKLSNVIQNNLQQYSENLFSYLQMKDMVRFDWKCDENGIPHFLEANTLPGLSKIYSVLPLMAKEAGIEYEEFLYTLFAGAYDRKHERHLWYGRQVATIS